MSKFRSFASLSRKVICVGRNYAKHAKELGNAVPTEPLLFLKPPSSMITQGEQIRIPRGYSELHHEVELGLVIGKRASCISPEEADEVVAGYFLGLDMTNRQLQSQAKKKGHPWSVCKGADTLLPVSDFVERKEIDNMQDVRLWCSVDGKMRQEGHTADMIFPVRDLVSYISHIFTLEPYDCILTGTPEGVGPVTHGSVIRAGIHGGVEMEFQVAEAPVDLKQSKL